MREILPGFTEKAETGFPSPAAGYIESRLDLNERLVRNPPATFFVIAEGDSMTGDGIFPGDTLIVDRSIEANGKIIVAVLDVEFILGRIRSEEGTTFLVPSNPAYFPRQIGPEENFMVWGVVTHSIRDH